MTAALADATHYGVEFWALPRDREPVALGDATDWKISPTDSDWGSIEFSYPPVGPHYDLLSEITDDDVDLDVEIVVSDGRRERYLGGILYTFDQDDSRNGGLARVTGHFNEVLFDEIRVPFNPDSVNGSGGSEDEEEDGSADQGETYVAGNAGQIVRQFIEAARSRSRDADGYEWALPGVWWRFTDSHDSFGQPWINEGAMSFSPGQTYHAVLGTLRGYQLCEWRVTADRELVLANVDTLGVDRTLTDPQVTLEYGRDYEDAPRKHTVRDAITYLHTAGKGGIHAWADDEAARRRRGRQVEGFHSFGNTSGRGALEALTSIRLNSSKDGTLELSHKLPLAPGSPLPLLDFDVFDWILSDTRRSTDRRRVKQLTIQGDSDDVTLAAVTLNAVIDETAVREKKRLDALESGAAIVGTSKPSPEVDDGSTPLPIDGNTITLDTRWYETPLEGTGRAAAFARWSPIPDARISGYILEWRYPRFGDSDDETLWHRLPEVRDPYTSWDGLVPDELVAVRVLTVNRWGRTSAPSSVATFSVRRNEEPPNQPSAPGVTSDLGLLIVSWDGLGSQGERMTRTFDRARVHISDVPEFDPTEETERTTLTGPSRVGVRVGQEFEDGEQYGRTYYVRLVALNREGLESPPSVAVPVRLDPLDDADLAALSISKLLVGELKALGTITGEGGFEARDPGTGNRIRFDATGLFAYRGFGNEPADRALEYRLADGILRLRGEYIAQGEGGAEIRISPESLPIMRLFSPNGMYGPAFLNAFDDLDGNGNPTGRTNLGINTGLDGPDPGSRSGRESRRYSRTYFTPLSANMQVVDGNQAGTGGQVTVRDDGVDVRFIRPAFQVSGSTRRRYVASTLKLEHGFAELGFWRADSSDQLSRVICDNQGEVRLDSYVAGYATAGFDRQGRFFIQDAGGGIYRGIQQIKNFVIPHPTDDERWLVHGCTESPVGGVEYWGTAEIAGGRVVVPLPDYFEALTERRGRGVQVTPLDAPAPRWWQRTPSAWASYPADGQFEIRTRGLPDGARVSWLVKAARSDASFPVEPRRDEVEVGGDGPYRYLREVA